MYRAQFTAMLDAVKLGGVDVVVAWAWTGSSVAPATG